ncbi:hypothetical protein AB1Y20_007215 [Prymnesium parvum]|uniref:Uncharacterized protein n=1 Tax=Prymnesium parvum TaxID=97485 RepID=A0AB34IU75_PRYPA|mmetsp:Transcript_27434/g.66357  ORF Transcript_27434/g.66357 Transcript_27434/m.66357 type:complete len:389 (+) Transcript_27434:1-1167(+)
MEKERKMKMEAVKTEATNGPTPQTPPIDAAGVQISLAPEAQPRKASLPLAPLAASTASGPCSSSRAPPLLGPKNASSKDLSVSKEAPPSNRRQTLMNNANAASAFQRARSLTHKPAEGPTRPPAGIDVKVLPKGRRNSASSDTLKVPGFPYMRKSGPKNASSRDLSISKEAPPSNRRTTQVDSSRDAAAAFDRAKGLSHAPAASPQAVEVRGELSPGSVLPIPPKSFNPLSRRNSGAPVKFTGTCSPANLQRGAKNASSRDLTITKEAPPSNRRSTAFDSAREAAAAFERGKELSHAPGASSQALPADNALPLPPNSIDAPSGAPVKFSDTCSPANLQRGPKNSSSRDLTVSKEAPPSSRRSTLLGSSSGSSRASSGSRGLPDTSLEA